ncbi:hypothetical protein F5Y03DRAFT_374012 [Xylaria venustula]|nr:hypothetical protein F5Y03DRAFT_374012 [Xylaria venustula]
MIFCLRLFSNISVWYARACIIFCSSTGSIAALSWVEGSRLTGAALVSSSTSRSSLRNRSKVEVGGVLPVRMHHRNWRTPRSADSGSSANLVYRRQRAKVEVARRMSS